MSRRKGGQEGGSESTRQKGNREKDLKREGDTKFSSTGEPKRGEGGVKRKTQRDPGGVDKESAG